jgi:hypothetical protein
LYKVTIGCVIFAALNEGTQPRVAVLPNTLPLELVEDLQNHFLSGILAPMGM